MQLEDGRVLSHGVRDLDVLSAQQSFVSTNVADDLDRRVPRRVLLDEEADRGREARREAARGQNRDFRLRVAWVGACGAGRGGRTIWRFSSPGVGCAIGRGSVSFRTVFGCITSSKPPNWSPEATAAYHLSFD